MSKEEKLELENKFKLIAVLRNKSVIRMVKDLRPCEECPKRGVCSDLPTDERLWMNYRGKIKKYKSNIYKTGKNEISCIEWIKYV